MIQIATGIKLGELEQLTLRHQQGDRQASEELFHLAQPKLNRIIKRNVIKYPEDADDIESDVYFGALTAANSWDPLGGDSFSSWMSEKARWAVIDGMRDRNKTRNRNKIKNRIINVDIDSIDRGGKSRTHARLLQQYTPLPDQIAEANDQALFQVTHLIKGLSAREQRLFYLRYGRLMKMKEIEAHLNLSESRISQILKNLNPTLAQKAQHLNAPQDPNLFAAAVREWYEQNPDNWKHCIILPKTALLMEQYQACLAGERRYNPIQIIDQLSLPIVRKAVIEEAYNGKMGLKDRLIRRRFKGLVSRKGVGGLVKETAPELFPDLDGFSVHQWNQGDESVRLGINKIKRFLHKEDKNYRTAEKKGDRDLRVNVIRDLIKREKRLSDYLRKNGLRNIMNLLTDPKGINGLKAAGSPLALFEFFDYQDGLDMFDRMQEVYVPKLWFRERGMYQKGAESVQLVFKGIQDVLWEDIQGYKQAELKGDREACVEGLKRFIWENKKLQEYLIKKGLGKVMDKFVNGDGTNGFRKKNSPKALFEFYDYHSHLNLFDRDEETYVPRWWIRERGMWQGQNGIELGIEAIQDVLWELDNYKYTEKTTSKPLQLAALDKELFSKKETIVEWLYSKGLEPVMAYVIKKPGSPKALFEFYNNHMEFDWFNRDNFPYMAIDSRNRLKIVDNKVTEVKLAKAA